MTVLKDHDTIINQFMGYELKHGDLWLKPRYAHVPENSRGFAPGKQIFGHDLLRQPYSESADKMLQVFEQLEFCKFDICWAVGGFRCILTLIEDHAAFGKTIPEAMAKAAALAIQDKESEG